MTYAAAIASPQDQMSHGARFFHVGQAANLVTINQGHCYVTDKEDEVLVTTLGSCISACIRDPYLQLGGMNHFMLPVGEDGQLETAGFYNGSLRYGNFAMEQLINGILARGGVRERLEVKLFGAGNVLAAQTDVGNRNAEFVAEYLKAEGMSIAASDLRGNFPRRIRYYPTSGRVQMLKLKGNIARRAIEEEMHRKTRMRQANSDGDIELFD